MDESKVGKFDQLVRPIVTIALTGAFIFGFIQGTIDTQNFVPVVIMAIGFWFGSRAQAAPPAPSITKTTETDPSGAKREVTMTASAGAAPPIPVPIPVPLTPPPPDPTKGG
jgi:hypothetical protein